MAGLTTPGRADRSILLVILARLGWASWQDYLTGRTAQTDGRPTISLAGNRRLRAPPPAQCPLPRSPAPDLAAWVSQDICEAGKLVLYGAQAAHPTQRGDSVMWRQGRGVWGGALKTEEARRAPGFEGKQLFLKFYYFETTKTTHRSQEAVWLCRGRAQTLHLHEVRRKAAF